MSRLRIVFVVQGEGRGHMTQALAAARFLREAGHEIVRVLLGSSPFRSVPDYFVRGIDAPVETFAAPTQVPDRAARALSVGRTVLDAARRLPAFVQSGRRIHEVSAGADVVVNFLDLLGGVSRVLARTRAPAVAVAHNYVFLHPSLAGAPGASHVRALVAAYTRATAARASTWLALSFGPLGPGGPPRLRECPPLLRPGLDTRAPRDEGFLVAYALNPGYGELLAAWQRRNPDVTVHCFIQGGRASLAGPLAPGFHAHDLDQERFLDHLARCRGFVGSAGFESLCEAFHLGKPVLAVPTKGQPEQALNAWDAERAGAARAGTYDDLDAFWRDPPVPPEASVAAFRAWVARAPEILVDAVACAAGGRGSASA